MATSGANHSAATTLFPLDTHYGRVSPKRLWTGRVIRALTALLLLFSGVLKLLATICISMALATTFLCSNIVGEDEVSTTSNSQGIYRLPFADDTQVKVFDDFRTHRPPGRIDIYAIDGTDPHPVVAAASGKIVAIKDGYSEQQSGRAAALYRNNYVWIAHSNGEWTNYSHLAHGSVTGKAGLRVGDEVKAGQYIRAEGAVGCARLMTSLEFFQHHFAQMGHRDTSL